MDNIINISKDNISKGKALTSLLEKICAGIFAVGFIFDMEHWKGAEIIVLFSMLLLTLLYFPFGILLFNNIPFLKLFTGKAFQNISPMRLAGSILAGISLSVFVTAILFEIFHWKEHPLLLFAGTSSCGISFLLILYKNFQKKTNFYPLMFIRFALWFIFAALLFFR